jgi:hypothetical protein
METHQETNQEAKHLEIGFIVPSEILGKILTFLPASLDFLLISKDLKNLIEQPNHPLGRTLCLKFYGCDSSLTFQRNFLLNLVKNTKLQYWCANFSKENTSSVSCYHRNSGLVFIAQTIQDEGTIDIILPHQNKILKSFPFYKYPDDKLKSVNFFESNSSNMCLHIDYEKNPLIYKFGFGDVSEIFDAKLYTGQFNVKVSQNLTKFSISKMGNKLMIFKNSEMVNEFNSPSCLASSISLGPGFILVDGMILYLSPLAKDMNLNVDFENDFDFTQFCNHFNQIIVETSNSISSKSDEFLDYCLKFVLGYTKFKDSKRSINEICLKKASHLLDVIDCNTDFVKNRNETIFVYYLKIKSAYFDLLDGYRANSRNQLSNSKLFSKIERYQNLVYEYNVIFWPEENDFKATQISIITIEKMAVDGF